MLRGESKPDWTPPAAELHSEWQTLAHMLRGVAEYAPSRGMYVIDPRGSQEFRTYTQILEAALRTGASLRLKGIGPLDRVLLVQSTGFEFLAAFFGTVAIGATPVPYPAPLLEHESAGMGEPHFVRTARRLGVQAIIADAELEVAGLPGTGPTGPFRFLSDVPTLLEGMPVGAAVEAQTSLPEVAYIQLTAGTTGRMRGVELTHTNILSNVEAIGRAVEVTEDDIGVSWIPPYNSMGLVGVICFGLYWGIDIVMLHPQRFLKHPEDWLSAISTHGGSLSTAPNFAYHYALRRCQESNLEGLDLSSWRVAMSGAEPVRAQHMDAFVRRFSNYGLQHNVFMPVYGLAEATLGVTFGDLNEAFVIDGINRRVLEREGRAEPLPEEGARVPAERLHLVSVGRPLDQIEVAIVDPAGHKLDERRCGEVAVRGPNVMKGYADVARADRAKPTRCTRLEGDWLYTGDVGYLADERLYIVGRACDAVCTARGRTLYPEEVELFVNSVDSIRAGSAVAFAVPAGPPAEPDAESEPAELLVIAYELQAGTEPEPIEEAVRTLLAKHLAIDPHALVALSPGSVPKTPSGKVRRFLARKLYLADRLDRRKRSGELDGVRRLLQRARSEVTRLSNDLYERLEGWWSS